MCARDAGKSTGLELRLCVIPPLRYKGRFWVTRGQVCTGNQMFLSAQLPVSSQISSLAKLIHLSPFQRRSGGGGVNVRRYVNASEKVPCQTYLLHFCFSFLTTLFASRRLLTAVPSAIERRRRRRPRVHMSRLTKTSDRMKALCAFVAIGFQV